jgi:hypothetical protein
MHDDLVVTQVLVQVCLIAAGHPITTVLVSACAAELFCPLLGLLLGVMKALRVGAAGQRQCRHGQCN